MKEVLPIRKLCRDLVWAIAASTLLIAINSPAAENIAPENSVVVNTVKENTLKEQAIDTQAGKAVYKKANCIGCHKWHGDGGGGYGGLALSLRKTQLDRAGLALLIRCGRPGTRMPYHNRKAYRGDDRNCYDSTKAELGDALPPRAHYFLREQDVDAVISYVVNHIQGKGSPNYADCATFWGGEARQCRSMQKRESTPTKGP